MSTTHKTIGENMVVARYTYELCSIVNYVVYEQFEDLELARGSYSNIIKHGRLFLGEITSKRGTQLSVQEKLAHTYAKQAYPQDFYWHK